MKWAFGFPKGVTNNSQPTVVSGRVFASGDNGYTYSLDAKTGCVYWSFQNGSIVRNSPMVGAVSGQGTARWAVFFGDGHANVFALDAQTGRQLWKTRVDDHVVARITAGVKYYEGRVSMCRSRAPRSSIAATEPDALFYVWYPFNRYRIAIFTKAS